MILNVGLILFLIFFSHECYSYSIDNSNSVIFGANYYFKNYKYADQVESQLQLLSENKISVNEAITFKASPIVSIANGSVEKKNQFSLDAKEFIFNYSNSNLTLDLGYLNLKKEGPDVIDVFDYFQPRNYENILSIRKMSVLGASLEVEPIKNLFLTSVYVPENRLSKLPRSSSIWYPRENKLPLSSADTVATLPPDSAFEISSSTYEKKSDLQNNYLLRIKYSISSMDLIFQTAESISNMPIIIPTLTGTLVSINPTEIALQNPIQLDFVWKKNKNTGLGLIYSFNDLGLIAKAFQNITVTPEDETTNTVIALEKQFQNIVLIYEHSNSYKNSPSVSNALAATDSLLSNADAIAARYAISESVNLKFGAFVNTKINGHALLASADFHINDTISSEFQCVQISGERSSIIGIYENADNCSIQLTALF